MVVSLLPNARTQFIDLNGAPLVDGTVEFYIPSSSTPKDTWQDSGGSILNDNPVPLDLRGQASIWGDGYYRQVVKDRNGVTIWDDVTLAPNGTATAATSNLLVYETIADAQAATIPNGVSTILVNRYASDRPIFPTVYEVTTANVINFRSNSNSRKWRVAQGQDVNFYPFGAYGDGASYAIDSQDILDNPQWIGIYTAGTEWDTVAAQETINFCFANAASSPGSRTFNLSNNIKNRPLRYGPGKFRINKALVAALQGFEFSAADRNACVLLDYVAAAPCLVCDSAAFGVFNNITISLQVLKDQGVEMWSLDGTGTYGGLKTQQVTINDPQISGNTFCDIGLTISRAGGAAQGDTIAINNPFINNCMVAGLDIGPSVNAQNALSIQVNGGNFQGCPTSVRVNGGSVYVDGTSFQPGNGIFNLGFRGYPYVNQITNGGADYKVDSGAGGSVVGSLTNTRTEGSVAALGLVPYVASNVVAAAADIEASYTSFYYTDGITIHPTTNNALNRVFLVVDPGGDGGVWYQVPNTGTTNVLGPFSGAAWTPGAWVGLICAYRFGGGFVSYVSITANTADTLTLSSAIATNTSSFVSVVGNTAAVEPAWDSATGGKFTGNGALNAFTTVDGSDIVSISASTIANNDYIAIQSGRRFGTPGERQFPCMFIAKVTNAAYGAGQIQIDRPAELTLNNQPGFYGVGTFMFGDYVMMEVPFSALSGASDLSDASLPVGWMRGVSNSRNVDVTYVDYAGVSTTQAKSYSPVTSYTPTLTATTPPTGASFTAQSGSYRVNAGQCTYTFDVTVASLGAGGAGAVRIVLPLAAAEAGAGTVSLGYVTFVGSPALYAISGYALANIELSSSGGSGGYLQWGALAGGGSPSRVHGSISYRVQQ